MRTLAFLRKAETYIGTKFNRLTIISITHLNEKTGGYNCDCLCECGTTKNLPMYIVKNGGIKSCGCLNREQVSIRNTKRLFKHGQSSTRIYSIWCGMMGRVNNIKNPEYGDYGGRGIKICDSWTDYLNFKDWATNNGYEEQLTIDRIDVNGNYAPNNCRWATPLVQANNRRNNIYIEYNGERLTAAQWSRRLGSNPSRVSHRIKSGWDIIRAITTPILITLK